MVDRKLLVEDWQQVETVLTDMELTDMPWDYTMLIKGLYRTVWHILEYLIRRDKA